MVSNSFVRANQYDIIFCPTIKSRTIIFLSKVVPRFELELGDLQSLALPLGYTTIKSFFEPVTSI